MSKKNKEADNVQKVFWTVTNQASKLLLDVDPDTFEQRLFKAMGIVAKVVDVDRMYIWKNFLMDGKLHCSQIYEWSENVKSVQDTDLTIRIPYDEVAPDWEEQLSNGRSINSLVSNMAPEIREHLEKQGVLSILIEPIFIDEEFWGFVGFDDCHKERIFTDNEDEMLRLSALLFGQAYHRNEQEKKQKRKQKGKQEQEQGNLSANLERFANKLVRFGKKMDKRVVRLKRRYKKIVRKAIKPFKKFNKSIKKLKKDGLFGLATATTITTFVTLPIVLLILVLVLKKNVNNGSLQKTKTIVVNGVPFDMIFVNGCTFTMGGLDTRDNGSNRDNEKPFFTAVVRDFYISNTPVTQTLWKAVMNRNPSTIIGQDLPVVNVSWDDCQVFIQRLNNLTGMKFRLPTEAEWEFAARGGANSHGYKFSGSNDIEKVAWYSLNTMGQEIRLQPVATKKANELGLFDMNGNVWEWVYDWYGEYTPEAKIDPAGPDEGTHRVNRGGSWSSMEPNSRIAARNYTVPTLRYDNLGFRLALD